MGYYSRHTGKISIDPPLDHQEVAQFKAIEQNDFELYVETARTESPDGTLISHKGLFLEPRTSEEYKGYYFLDALGEVAKLFGETHTFTGHILVEGEESGDVHRYVIRGTEAKDQRATFAFEEDE